MNSKAMQKAIRLSYDKMVNNEGGPFGAVITLNDEIIAEGWNRVTSGSDPTAHAEIVAIRAACKHLGSFDLSGCEIYSSCEPCPMCLAAIYWARLDRLYYACGREDAAAAGFDDSHIYDEISLPSSERKLKMIQCMRDDALTAFVAWMKKEDRREY